MISYTYLLIHIPSGKKYYGVRYAKNCSPDDFWTKYFTSSKKVKELIKEYGKDSFTFEIRKTFTTTIDAIKWEEKVLRRMKILHNENWLNQNIAGAIINTPETISKMIESNKKVRIYKTGFKPSAESRKKMSDAKKGKPSPNKGKKMSEEQKEKISIKLKGKIVKPETREKLKNSALRRHKKYNEDGSWNWVFN